MMVGKNPNARGVAERLPKDSVGVELGVWRGGTSRLFLDSGKVRFLHLVDAWSVDCYKDSADWEAYLDRYEKTVGVRSPAAFRAYYESVFLTVVNQFRDDPVKIHRYSTREFFQRFHELVDWVYVDASHEHEDVLADLEGSLGIIRPKGSIFGDDYGNKVGVITAVSAFAKKHALKVDVFSTNQYQISL